MTIARWAIGLVAFSLLVAACNKRATDPTTDWFREHRAKLDKVKEMLVADHGLVGHVGLGWAGGLHGASGANGGCGSRLRGNSFPWACWRKSGEAAPEVHDVAEVEAFLGLPPGRLEAYAKELPASVATEVCTTDTAYVFWLEDPDMAPCTGKRNVVWSATAPARKPSESCRTTVETHYVPLAGGWYAHACVRPAK